MIAIINSIAIDRFFQAICYYIFEYLLVANSKNMGLFGSISIYFCIIEINSQEMIYLHYLV